MTQPWGNQLNLPILLGSSALVGLLAQVTVARSLGAGAGLDGYLLSNASAAFISAVSSGAFSQVVLLRAVPSREVTLASNTGLVLAASILATVSVIGTYFILGRPDTWGFHVLTGTAPADTLQTATKVTASAWMHHALQAGCVIVVAGLNARSQLIFPVLSMFLPNIVIFGLAWSGNITPLAAQRSFLAGSITQYALLVMRLSDGKPQVPSWRNVREALDALIYAGPFSVAYAAPNVVPLIERYVAATMPPGTMSLIAYASRIPSAAAQLVGQGLGTVAYSRAANALQTGNAESAGVHLKHGLTLYCVAVMPVFLWSPVWGRCATALLFPAQSNDTYVASTLALVTPILSLAACLSGAGHVAGKAFFLRGQRIGNIVTVGAALLTYLGLCALYVTSPTTLAFAQLAYCASAIGLAYAWNFSMLRHFSDKQTSMMLQCAAVASVLAGCMAAIPPGWTPFAFVAASVIYATLLVSHFTAAS